MAAKAIKTSNSSVVAEAVVDQKSINVSGGQVKNVYGGSAEAVFQELEFEDRVTASAKATGNQVTISANEEMIESAYGGYAESMISGLVVREMIMSEVNASSTATGNQVTIESGANVNVTNVYGGFAWAEITGNDWYSRGATVSSTATNNTVVLK